MSEIGLKKAFKGFIWSGVENITVQGIRFAVTLIISRLISPSDYGLIAMLNIFIALAQLFIDGGFSNALIQNKYRNNTDFSTVFYFNLIISIIIYCLLFILAPYIAKFYNQEKLIEIIRWISITFIFNSLSIVQRTKLMIDINFKLQTKISLIAVVISGATGIFAAWNGYGVWALVLQSILFSGTSAILFFLFTKWHPVLIFSLLSLKKMFSFGSKLLFSSFIHVLYTNMYTLIIGCKYNANRVGFYNQANSISAFVPVNLSSVLMKVLYPIQCSYQEDRERIIKILSDYTILISYVMFPVMLFFSIASGTIVNVILGDKWEGVSVYFSILSIAYMWYPLMMMNAQILSAMGRSDLFLRSELIKKLFSFLILVITVNHGVIIICFGILCYNIIDLVIILYFTNKVIGFNAINELKILAPNLLLSLFMIAPVYWIMNIFENDFLKIMFGIALGVSLYISLSIIFKIKGMQLAMKYINHLYKY